MRSVTFPASSILLFCVVVLCYFKHLFLHIFIVRMLIGERVHATVFVGKSEDNLVLLPNGSWGLTGARPSGLAAGALNLDIFNRPDFCFLRQGFV